MTDTADEKQCGARTYGTPCLQEATFVAVTPWGENRFVCDEHARSYSQREGFKCTSLKPPAENARPCLVCWCGAGPATKYSVDGSVFAVCTVHAPPPLADLFWRFVARLRYGLWRRFFKPRPPLLTPPARPIPRRRP